MLTRRRLLSSGTTSLVSLASSRLAIAAPLSTYARRVLEKKPCGYWRLGEKAGPNVADASGQEHTGTAHGAVTFGQKGMLDRDADTALVFDGKTSYVEIPSHPSFSQPTSGAGLTVEVWMRPDVLDFTGEGEENYIHWLGKGESGKHEWAFRFYPRQSSRPNRISAYIFSPGPGLGSGAYTEEEIKPGKWIHIVATYDPGDATNPKAGVTMYKDGKMTGSPATAPGAPYKSYDVMPVAGTAPLRIGTRDTKNFFVGALDELAIYPRVLTAREVADNYRAGRAG
ncbi:LamG domain-containing protein [Prosthecobacter sp. SYSU 5D2]|uniref:LamG domain-containing protein n=1 Tax=Prosthecobacter sp. SYSU 5D2 TaxID=3134134 RepID=UPI0031FEA5F6